MRYNKGDKVKIIHDYEPGAGLIGQKGKEATFVRYTNKNNEHTNERTYPYVVKVKVKGIGQQIHVNKIRKITNKKADGKRIALGQSHEVAYIKKIAKQWIERLETDNKLAKKEQYIGCSGITLFVKPKPNFKDSSRDFKTKSLIRCLKALIKYIERS